MIGTKSIKGTELEVGMVRAKGWKESTTVTDVKIGRLEAGARYADITCDDGITDRCWEGFLYSILSNH